MTEKGVGGLPDAGTIEPGDPGHIETHDRMAELIQSAADANGIILDPPVPPPAVPGEDGHVAAHNTLLANIEQLAAEGGGGFASVKWAAPARTTGAVETYSYPTDNGMFWDVYEFPGAGSITTPIDGGGLIDVLVVGGGGGGRKYGQASSAGGGACVRWGAFFINENDTYLVTVGAGGPSTATGNLSKIDRVLMSGPGKGGLATDVGGYQSVTGMGGGGSAGGMRHSSYGVTEGGGAGGGVYSADNKAGVPLEYTGVSVNYGTSRTSGNGVARTGEGGGHNTSTSGGDGVIVLRVQVEKPSFNPKRASVPAETAHAARIDDDIVVEVIVTEAVGKDEKTVTQYVNSLGIQGRWVHGNGAGVGFHFRETEDGGEFINPIAEQDKGSE